MVPPPILFLGRQVRCVTVETLPTLIRLKRDISTVYLESLQRFGFQFEGEEVKAAYKNAFKVTAEEYPHFTVLPYKDWWRLSVQRTLLDNLGMRSRISERQFELIFQFIFSEFNSSSLWEAQPGAKRSLVKLRERGIIVGIVDNNYERYHDNTLPSCDALHEQIDFSSVASQVGSPKPFRPIFEDALAKANATLALREGKASKLPSSPLLPEECVHIGNTLSTDYVGAKKFGMESLLIDPHHKIQKKLEANQIDFSRLQGIQLGPEALVESLEDAVVRKFEF